MTDHTFKYKAQRDRFNELVVEVQNEYKKNLECPDDRHDMFVADFSQNITLPWYGSDQPGDTYYYSPLNINLFGVYNCGSGIMNAFLYPQYESTKGANDVCSLLWLTLLKTGINPDCKVTRKKLTLVFDNCPGQNKNKVVLKFSDLLVERKYYKKVDVFFFVAGHTKNICDSKFSQMKEKIHKRNIYDYDCLINLLVSKLSDIDIIPVTAKDFKEWKVFLNTIYRLNFKSNIICPNHCFSFDVNKRFIMSYKVFIHDPDSQTQDMLKKGVKLSQIQYNLYKQQPKPKTMNLEVFNKTQCQLYDHYRVYLPEYVHDRFCKKPPPEVWEAYMEKKNSKKKKKGIS